VKPLSQIGEKLKTLAWQPSAVTTAFTTAQRGSVLCTAMIDGRDVVAAWSYAIDSAIELQAQTDRWE